MLKNNRTQEIYILIENKTKTFQHYNHETKKKNVPIFCTIQKIYVCMWHIFIKMPHNIQTRDLSLIGSLLEWHNRFVNVRTNSLTLAFHLPFLLLVVESKITASSRPTYVLINLENWNRNM